MKPGKAPEILQRRSLYVGKTDYTMNKDINKELIVPNAQMNSNDQPDEFKTTLKYFSLEQFEKKSQILARLRAAPKTDVVGNILVQREKPDTSFIPVLPSGIREVKIVHETKIGYFCILGIRNKKECLTRTLRTTKTPGNQKEVVL